MSAYRKRFVQFNMLLIGIVLTVMVAVVAAYMVRDYYSGLRSTMEQVVAPLRFFPKLLRESRIGRAGRSSRIWEEKRTS